MDIINEEVKEFTIERLKRSQDYEMSYFHYHSCYELFIILSGERKMILQDKIYQGCAGNVFLIPPQYIHRTSGAENIRVLIQFTEEYLRKYFSQYMINKMLKCFDIFTLYSPSGSSKLSVIVTGFALTAVLAIRFLADLNITSSSLSLYTATKCSV